MPDRGRRRVPNLALKAGTLASGRISVYLEAMLLAFSLLAAAPPPADAPLMPPTARTDLVAAFRQMIAALDSDHDGRLSLAEWSAGTGSAAEGGSRAAAADRASPIRVLLGAPAADLFRLWDGDEDGLLTLEELVRQPLASFDCMDADHDGIVQAGEAEAATTLCPSTEVPETGAADESAAGTAPAR